MNLRTYFPTASFILHIVVLLSISTGSILNFECLAQGLTTECEDPSTCVNDQIGTNTDTENDVVDYDDGDVDDCQDDHHKCFDWSRVGECDANPVYMLTSCRRSCKHCPDQAEELAAIIAAKEAKKRVYTQNELAVGVDMGEPQSLEDSMFHVSEGEIMDRMYASRKSIRDSNFDDDLISICLNKHEKCVAWAVAGECEKNKKYMITNCAPACMTCDKLTIESRCPIDPDAKAAWESGDLNTMFERLTSKEVTAKFNVTILSEPPAPWVVIVDDVVSDVECKRLIELGDTAEYKRSEDVGAKNPDGTYGSIVSTGRTSSNAWCNSDCYKDPIAVQASQKLGDLVMINETNSEYLQLLKYEPGQFYEDHHDYIEHNRERQQGVRILTAYLYLNDVEAGGGTKFTGLNLTVMPKRGRVLLWPSVLNDKPHEKDHRTNHQALPVEAGVKFGANGWFHQFDFKGPYEEGCSS